MLHSAPGASRSCRPPVSRFTAGLKAGAALALLLTLAACGGGGSSPQVDSVRVGGSVTYDFVPAVATKDAQGSFSARLDYSKTLAKPARGVQVEAVADDGTVLAATQADANGGYLLTVPANTSIRLRAKARLLQAPGNGPSWDFAVRDNTSPGYGAGQAALYAVQGEAFGSGSADLVQNLHAGSGWGGGGYSGPRAAAPFAILDQVYAARQKVLAVDANAVFAPMIVYWSPNNRPAGDNPSVGYIGTSHWNPGGNRPGLYILGAENTDTDEYDSAVIVHEWGHYFESSFARADSPGGPHGSADMLDMRLAFGEGWGNSLAGMVRDDPLYVDTQGPQQAMTGVVFDLDQIDAGEPLGWFNEASVQHVLYEWYKAPALGFASIYRVMTGPQKTTDAFTSLFSFSSYLRGQAGAAGQGVIDQQLAAIQTANGAALDIWGSTQIYPSKLPVGGDQFVLPIYTPLPLNQPTQLCRTGIFGNDGNKLGNIRYLRLTIAQAGNYNLKINSGDVTPDLIQTAVYRRGREVPSQAINTDTVQLALTAGDYVATITTDKATPQVCFSATLTQ